MDIIRKLLDIIIFFFSRGERKEAERIEEKEREEFSQSFLEDVKTNIAENKRKRDETKTETFSDDDFFGDY